VARQVRQERDRRWIRGEGAAPPDEAIRLLSAGLGKQHCSWKSAGRAAGRGVDQVDAERLLWRAVDAGLVEITERRARSGNWEPYRWSLTEDGVEFAATPQHEWGAEEVRARFLEGPAGEAGVLGSIRSWLTAAPPASELERRLVAEIGLLIRGGRTPRGRLLSLDLAGDTKAVRVTDHRDVLEEAFEAALEDVIRLHGQAVLAHGAFSFHIGGEVIDGRWSVPWLALTQDTLGAMRNLQVKGRRLLTVENLVAFEEDVRAGLDPDTIAVFTSGFPRVLEQRFLSALVAAGVERVDHWGDLDLGGLRILRVLDELLPVPVLPFRMEPELLDRLPTKPLTGYDRGGLKAWVADEAAPCRELAAAMLERDRKVEQEGWFLAGPGREFGSG